MKQERRPSMLAWLVGALALAPAEILALDHFTPSFLMTVVVLLATFGLLCGAVIAAADLLVQALALPAPLAASIRALPAAFPLAFAAAHLFDGGFASTLPGAAYGHILVPVAGTLLLAGFLALVAVVLPRRHARAVLAGLLVVATCAVELVNRQFLPSLYPDLHALAVLIAVVSAGSALHLVWPPLPPRLVRSAARARIRLEVALPAAISLVVLGAFLAVLFRSLDSDADRARVATRGMHVRQIARFLRATADHDGDGYATILGGGDCDDRHADVNPAARDIPGNGRDEDCDGADAQPAPPPPPGELGSVAAYRDALAGWRASPDMASFLAKYKDAPIILVLVDALRADALAPEQQAAMPTLHALLAESRHALHAFAASAGTDVSVAALLTGRFDPFTRIETTLPEALGATGRIGHAVVPREVLRWAGKTLITRGLAGHDVIVTDRKKRDVGSHSTSQEITDRGLAFLDKQAGQPVFLWLHYFDVHEHHQVEDGDPRLREALAALPAPSTSGAQNPAERKYRAMASIVDGELARLIEGLRQRGLWDRAIFIVLADHGESLGEDPRLGDTHGNVLYNPLVHVPLVMRIPGVAPGVLEHPLSLVDVTATLVGLAGAAPLAGADGIDFLPQLVDRDSVPAPLLSYRWPLALGEIDQHGVIDWPYKLLVRPGDNLLELYDLDSDFAEASNLASEEPDVARRMRSLLQSMPQVIVDRSRKARKQRDELARPPERSETP